MCVHIHSPAISLILPPACGNAGYTRLYSQKRNTRVFASARRHVSVLAAHTSQRLDMDIDSIRWSDRENDRLRNTKRVGGVEKPLSSSSHLHDIAEKSEEARSSDCNWTSERKAKLCGEPNGPRQSHAVDYSTSYFLVRIAATLKLRSAERIKVVAAAIASRLQSRDFVLRSDLCSCIIRNNVFKLNYCVSG